VGDTQNRTPVGQALPRAIATALPIYYGWVVLACLCCAGFARQGPAVATLTVFVEPLTREFGWSRTALSGAVSLGGVLAALVSPLIGPLLDRRGSRLILCLAILVNGIALLLLSLTPSLLVFYLLFCVARMNWAGPFDLGIYGALNNWFQARRTVAASVINLVQMFGLVAMPLIAQFAMLHGGWRAGWLALGAVVLVVGFVPVCLFLVRRPEDMGIEPDRAKIAVSEGSVAPAAELSFSREEAIRTPAFWLLMLYTMMMYPVQAGVSLHQAPHLIARGLDPTAAAFVVSGFSLMSMLATAACGFIPRRFPVRFPLALAAAMMAGGTLLLPGVVSMASGFLAAGVFGLGLGAMLTLTPIAWADYFGRANYASIRGYALSSQVLAQAAGPLLSGALYDWIGTYSVSLHCFAVLSGLGLLAALAAIPPRRAQDM
jgi:MFS family permease